MQHSPRDANNNENLVKNIEIAPGTPLLRPVKMLKPNTTKPQILQSLEQMQHKQEARANRLENNNQRKKENDLLEIFMEFLFFEFRGKMLCCLC